MNWTTANTWANTLVVASNAGPIGGRRLPTMVDTGTPGCNHSFAGGTDCGYNVQTASSEMAHLWYVALGNKAYCDPVASTVSTCVVQEGWGPTNTGNYGQSNGLYALFGGKPVDLAFRSILRNPYRKRAIEPQLRLLYG